MLMMVAGAWVLDQQQQQLPSAVPVGAGAAPFSAATAGGQRLGGSAVPPTSRAIAVSGALQPKQAGRATSHA